eukprot:CAMPEP_0170392974 /NCGR_PEP_ID=MMETSP0117_2-20130122/20474_1 /TAXON_ID=400756 /ORGANISM="Durinskia baltica, Strain CSIRO CS-38" /LENGTH=31 /DNA_ID= /DNA_START= /DNA_END= /DNA_ORIENTATION=
MAGVTKRWIFGALVFFFSPIWRRTTYLRTSS